MSAIIARIQQCPRSSSACAAGAPVDIMLSEVKFSLVQGGEDAEAFVPGSFVANASFTNVVFTACPAAVGRVTIAWRRRSTNEEIRSIIKDVQTQTELLRDSVDKAERLSLASR